MEGGVRDGPDGQAQDVGVAAIGASCSPQSGVSRARPGEQALALGQDGGGQRLAFGAGQPAQGLGPVFALHRLRQRRPGMGGGGAQLLQHRRQLGQRVDVGRRRRRGRKQISLNGDARHLDEPSPESLPWRSGAWGRGAETSGARRGRAAA